MKIEANTVDEYIAKAPEERQDTLLRLRRVLLEHLPEGYVEELSYGMPGYVVPHALFSGLSLRPQVAIAVVSFASQKELHCTVPHGTLRESRGYGMVHVQLGCLNLREVGYGQKLHPI